MSFMIDKCSFLICKRVASCLDPGILVGIDKVKAGTSISFYFLTVTFENMFCLLCSVSIAFVENNNLA